jgi:hypothetical protein
MATYHQFIVHYTTMPDCVKARGLVDWIFWTQTDPTAMSLASQCARFLISNHFPHTERSCSRLLHVLS